MARPPAAAASFCSASAQLRFSHATAYPAPPGLAGRGVHGPSPARLGAGKRLPRPAPPGAPPRGSRPPGARKAATGPRPRPPEIERSRGHVRQPLRAGRRERAASRPACPLREQPVLCAPRRRRGRRPAGPGEGALDDPRFAYRRTLFRRRGGGGGCLWRGLGQGNAAPFPAAAFAGGSAADLDGGRKAARIRKTRLLDRHANTVTDCRLTREAFGAADSKSKENRKKEKGKRRTRLAPSQGPGVLLVQPTAAKSFCRQSQLFSGWLTPSLS